MTLDAKARRALFIELAARPDGVTAAEVHAAALGQGDATSTETYHNIGRRLAAKGFLRSDKAGGRTVFRSGASPSEHWLDEDRLAQLLDQDHFYESLSLFREAQRHFTDIPTEVWIAIRRELGRTDARDMFCAAIEGYATDLRDSLFEYDQAEAERHAEIGRLRSRIDGDIAALRGLAKFGLGLSNDAVLVPSGFEAGLRMYRGSPGGTFHNSRHLRDEIERRVESGPFLREVEPLAPGTPEMLVAAVDGSTRGGLLAVEGEGGDFSIGPGPMVSINCAVAQINRTLKVDGRHRAAFMRLPERPEDMQRRDNRYAMMGRMFFPDLTESQYAHALWNAMNVLELRAAKRVMQRWEIPDYDVEVPPADLVMMDGTVIPNDRDSNHYAQQDNYGKIVRELIDNVSEMLGRSELNGQVVAGVVKNAQVRVLAPVVNWHLTQYVARSGGGALRAWPLQAMNSVPDQVLLTRVLTMGRGKGDPRVRTAYVLRPFHATTDLAERGSRRERPGDILEARAKAAREAVGRGEASLNDEFWAYAFNRGKDPYARLLDRAWCATFFLGAVPRMDGKQVLPRLEFLVPADTSEDGPMSPRVAEFGERFLTALRQDAFEVADDHSMFADRGKLDILPSLLIKAHETVKIFTEHLLGQAQEYLGRYIASYLKARGPAARLRPWRLDEIEAYRRHMERERGIAIGSTVRPRGQLSSAPGPDDQAA